MRTPNDTGAPTPSVSSHDGEGEANQQAKREADRLYGRAFPWGTVVHVHKIGVYAVIEYIDDNPRYPDGPTNEHRFHSVIDGRSTSHSSRSLDGALALCIAWRAQTINYAGDCDRDGWNVAANSQVVKFFERMIGGFVESHGPAATEASR